MSVFDIQLFIEHLKKGAALAGNSLETHQIDQMTAHARELMVWNRKTNLTAITDPQGVAEKHFIDSIVVNQFFAGENLILDMGTGGGFPAIPLKILNPDIQIVMVDSVRKKVNFLNHVVRSLELNEIEAIHGRVEDLAKDSLHANGYDAVMARGFAGLEKFAGLAIPFLKPGAKIYALKGKQAQEEITPYLEAQFDITREYYQLPFEKSDRYMICMTPKTVQ